MTFKGAVGDITINVIQGSGWLHYYQCHSRERLVTLLSMSFKGVVGDITINDIQGSGWLHYYQ